MPRAESVWHVVSAVFNVTSAGTREPHDLFVGAPHLVRVHVVARLLAYHLLDLVEAWEGERVSER